MSELIQETDYPGMALDLLIEQYKNSPNVVNILEVNGLLLNDLEKAIFEVRDNFYLATAEGVQLDVLGSIWDVERNGLSDTDYRALIQAKASLSVSGTPEDVIRVLQVLYGATFVNYFDAYPARYLIETDAAITDAQLTDLSPAGVSGILIDVDEPYLISHDSDAESVPYTFLLDHGENILVYHT